MTLKIGKGLIEILILSVGVPVKQYLVILIFKVNHIT